MVEPDDALPSPPPPEPFGPEEASDQLPVNLEADFAPLKGLEAPAWAEEADPYSQDSLQAQEAFDRAVAAAAAGREDLAMKQYLKASKLAEHAREWYLAAVSCQRMGDFLVKPPPPSDLERAFRMYHRAVAAYQQCGLYAEARRLSYALLWTRLRRARELKVGLGERLELLFYWASAGFGFRPLRVIGTALFLMVVYGLFYWSLGGVLNVAARQPAGLWEALYFSGTTFTTLGYGDFLPAPGVRLLTLTEGILGAFTIGFFVVVVGNRLRR